MTNNSQVMETLIDLSTKQVDAAAVRLAKANQTLLDAKAQLGHLYQYREEYNHRYENAMHHGLCMDSLRNYQSFLTKLINAIHGQEAVVAECQRQQMALQADWLECQKKKLSYSTLNTRQHEKAERIEAKREQKRNDEFALRSSSLMRV